MKILVIFTGGTIGCAPAQPGQPRGLPPGEPSAGRDWRDYYLLAEYYARGGRDVEFETAEPFATLSENMTLNKWNILLDSLKTVDFPRYGGIIITHGTDTLAYTAALLGIALWDISIPVALVSSGRDLYDPAANGYGNFAAAIDFITGGGDNPRAGVYVFYGYMPHETTVYIAARIKQSQPYTDRFEDIAGLDYGQMREGKFYPNPGFPHKSPLSPGGAYGGLLNKINPLSDRVLIIRPYPGMDYSCFNIDNTDAVLHETYHSFTFCVENQPGRQTSVLDFIGRCKSRGVRVFFAPFGEGLTQNAGGLYTSAFAALGTGAAFIEGVTLECAYAKLLLGFSMTGDFGAAELENFLGHEFFYEKHGNI